LSQSQEAIVLALRQSLYLPLDDLLFITKQYINPAVSRAGIARLLKREGISRLTDLIATAEGEKITPKRLSRTTNPASFTSTSSTCRSAATCSSLSTAPQRAIGSKTPVLALKEWQQKRPELFVKRVYDQTGLDT
jgi:pyocin large subunit-like protein